VHHGRKRRADVWGCEACGWIPVFSLSQISARFLCLASRQQTCHSRRSRFPWRPHAAAVACGRRRRLAGNVEGFVAHA